LTCLQEKNDYQRIKDKNGVVVVGESVLEWVRLDLCIVIGIFLFCLKRLGTFQI
jgi:hypothetical protein